MSYFKSMDNCDNGILEQFPQFAAIGAANRKYNIAIVALVSNLLGKTCSFYFLSVFIYILMNSLFLFAVYPRMYRELSMNYFDTSMESISH